MQTKKLLLSLAISLALTACSTVPSAESIAANEAAAQEIKMKAAELKTDAQQEKAEAYLSSVPAWVVNPPAPDEQGVYAVGIGESASMQVAIQKASLNAQFNLAKNYKQELSGNERSYSKDDTSGVTKQYTQLIDTIVDSVSIVGYSFKMQKIEVIDGTFYSYVLLKLPFDSYNKVLEEEKIKSNDDQVRQAFQELQDRLASRKQASSILTTEEVEIKDTL